jgi:hypothetical protein
MYLRFVLLAAMVAPAVSHQYIPPQVPLEVDNYPLAPEGLQLEQVQVFVRHGERTPVRVRMANAPASIPEHWNLCKTARQFKSAVYGTKDDYLEMRRGVEGIDGLSVAGGCLLGELTDVGRQVRGRVYSAFFLPCLLTRSCSQRTSLGRRCVICTLTSTLPGDPFTPKQGLTRYRLGFLSDRLARPSDVNSPSNALPDPQTCQGQ